jgi:hypothetical protein
MVFIIPETKLAVDPDPLSPHLNPNGDFINFNILTASTWFLTNSGNFRLTIIGTLVRLHPPGPSVLLV